jgi:hypothetical protein
LRPSTGTLPFSEGAAGGGRLASPFSMTATSPWP